MGPSRDNFGNRPGRQPEKAKKAGTHTRNKRRAENRPRECGIAAKIEGRYLNEAVSAAARRKIASSYDPVPS